MHREIQQALQRGGIIDITTIGRKSGNPHRIEISFHTVDGKVYISGMPGRRDWFANLLAHPEFTFHLKRGVQADLAARATPIRDVEKRRRLLQTVTRTWGREAQLERFVTDSPLVLVTFPEEGA